MSKQYTVNLSPAQSFDLWIFLFLRRGHVPKTRAESRLFRGVKETFGLKAIQDQVESLPDGVNLTTKDFSSEPVALESGSVDLNTLLGYLDKLDAAEPSLSDRLLDISDELLRAKEGRTLTSVPETVTDVG